MKGTRADIKDLYLVPVAEGEIIPKDILDLFKEQGQVFLGSLLRVLS